LTEQRLPPETVVVNGAAVNLLSLMIGGLETRLGESERRIVNLLDTRFAEHERRHSEYEARSAQDHGAFDRRLVTLEHDDLADDQAAAVAQARKAGRLHVIVWIRDYRAVVLAAIAAGVGWLVGVFTHLMTP